MTTRRAMLSLLPSAALVLMTPALAADAAALSDAYFQEHAAPAEATFFVSNAPKGERGDRMVIRGVVTDGEKPIPNASVYIYHTDNDGRYDPQKARLGDGADSPRLHGYMRTDSVGRYVYGSIRPAPHPSATEPAAVHFVVSAEGYKNLAIDMMFEGDTKTPADYKGRSDKPNYKFAFRSAQKDSNRVWQINFDIAMERQ